MKVVFLDLEGVLITHRTILMVSGEHRLAAAKDHYRGYPINKSWARFVDLPGLGLIAHMAKKHGARVVFSSTLRTHAQLRPVTLGLLEGLGASVDGFFPDALDQWRTSPDMPKGPAILDFIEKNKVTQYAVIDDNELKPLTKSHMVFTNPGDGFTLECYMAAQKLIADNPKELKYEAIFL